MRPFTVAVDRIRGAYSRSLPKPLAVHMGPPRPITFETSKGGKVSVQRACARLKASPIFGRLG